MATWLLVREQTGETNVLYRNGADIASAGRCSAATSEKLIVEWVINEASPADVIVTDEGAFALPFRSPTKWAVRC